MSIRTKFTSLFRSSNVGKSDSPQNTKKLPISVTLSTPTIPQNDVSSKTFKNLSKDPFLNQPKESQPLSSHKMKACLCV